MDNPTRIETPAGLTDFGRGRLAHHKENVAKLAAGAAVAGLPEPAGAVAEARMAQLTSAALARALIDKGLMTDDEWAHRLAEASDKAVERYEKAISEQFGTAVRLTPTGWEPK